MRYDSRAKMTAERMEQLLIEYGLGTRLKIMSADFGIAMSTVSYHAKNAGLTRQRAKA